MKRNGFCKPYHKHQIIAWILLAIISILFSILVLPSFADTNSVVFCCLFAMSLTSVLIFGFICTYLDPSDPALKEIDATSQSKPESAKNNKKYPKICKICDKYVSGNSKHCRRCQRCVNNFDHHCTWVNNCIGDVNYRVFFNLILCVQILVVTIISASSIVCQQTVTSSEDSKRIEEKLQLSDQSMYFYFSIVVLIIILCGIVGICNGQLILFHIWLKFKNMTTYEYILMRRRDVNKYKVSEINLSHQRNNSEEVHLEELYEPYIENPDYNLDMTRTQEKSGYSKRIMPIDNSFEIPSISRDIKEDDKELENPPSVSDMNTPRNELNRKWEEIANDNDPHSNSF
ncbi:unnamed protein product [Blepharisma stoltei]|uniref:Palmitoyltransferase n=1 Tax=Blepharisma stoltei TaxID=1481888 RepID=A0AAU9JFK8_9CILI|nr:unnamed protein product [Blepharisma stoltei]